jgi:predicted  nucleic acid-binding Zn-ribbon protein
LENKLRHLYELQLIDSALDDLEEMKGDLPAKIAVLEERESALSGRLATLQETMRSAFTQRDSADTDILSLKEKMETYKKKQFAVRNNREYDALTREMDSALETITRLEHEMEALETKATVARTEIEEVQGQLETLENELKEKQAALAEVTKSNEEEELRLQHEREKVIRTITKQDVVAYSRIRKAKRGQAVVPVKRGACGGCFARVTPQKMLELRQNSRIYTCEHCGRILVSDEIVQTAAKFL